MVSILAGPFHSLSLESCLGLSAPIKDVDLGSKVVQSAKVFAAKGADLSLISGTQMLEGEKRLLQVFLL